MTDFTQYTDEQLQAAMPDAYGTIDENDRRMFLRYVPSVVSDTLTQVLNRQGDRVETLVRAVMGDDGHGEHSAIAGSLIAALQEAVDAVPDES